MTKPFTPEFIDRVSAIAFIEGGRGHDGRKRPTKDAWNTVVERDGDDVRLMLDNTETIRWYQTGGTELVSIHLTGDTHVIRKRINDYVLHAQGFELIAGAKVVGPVGEARGNYGKPVPVRGVLGAVTGTIVLDLSATSAIISGLGGKPAPLPVWYKEQRLAPAWADYVMGYIGGLPAEIGERHDAPICMECSQIEPNVGTPIGFFTGNEHKFAHLSDPQLNLPLLFQMGVLNSIGGSYAATGLSLPPVKDPSKFRALLTRAAATHLAR
jgi:hypothetical protein